MKAKFTIALAAMTLSALLGFPTSTKAELGSGGPSPTEFSRPLPLEPKQLSPGFCQLGTSCMAMDARPFEPCLLSTKHCSDKAAEPMLVAPPPSLVPMPQVEALYRKAPGAGIA